MSERPPLTARPPSERERPDAETREGEPPAKSGSQHDDVSWGFQLWRSPLTIAVAGGIITLLAGTVSEGVKWHYTLALEEEKFQADLIKKYLEAQEPETRNGNLRFLIESGLVPLYADNISKYIKAHAGAAPQTIPAAGAAPLVGNFGPDSRVSGITLERLMAAKSAMLVVERRDATRWTTCSGFLLNDRQVLTADYCTNGSVAEGDGKMADIRLSGGALAETGEVELKSVAAANGVALVTLAVPILSAQPLVPSRISPVVGERLMLVYSDQGGTFIASLDAECAIGEVTEKEVAYRCDASPGSAGGAVLSAQTGAVIAVHTQSKNQNRIGIRMDWLASLPPLAPSP